ncbi:L-type lectin-domain containing receptor kinase SIT2-like [Musa acuminata AAA Group]|uniref:L-type lectin-domain containing receptor kinase SIT2-like n=1 Tax=Musa acuminata AAA Group TaxID=214697 RepID=UPI0031DC24CF
MNADIVLISANDLLTSAQSMPALPAPLPRLLLLLLLLSIYSPTLATEFLFNGFKEAANLSLDASALITSNGVLQLTNDSKRQIGHAFLSSPVHMLHNRSVAASFSTAFVFDIVTVNGSGGDGLAFVVATSKTLPGAQNGQFLGLLSTQNNGNFSNHLFAIEFDTVKAIGPFTDIDENHVGVDVNSLESNVSKSAAYYADGGKKVSVDLLSAQPIQAWIDYNGVTSILNVTIAPLPLPRPRRPLISHAIDLSPIFEEYMYVGFSAATGKLISYHYIMGWSFSTDGVASSLDLSQLPLPPRQKEASPASKASILKTAVLSSIVTLLFIVLVISIFMYLRKQAKLSENLEDWESYYPHRFPYKELYKATKGFQETELLGSGGFGQVYRGTLRRTGEVVAVKKISSNSRQGVREFIAEISSLGRMRHRNLVQLQGWCKRNEDLLLVYDFMPNGSLDTFLYDHDKSQQLSWNHRFKILKDIAFGLLYLHEEWEQVVVHRDIKSNNVLLDADMNARLGDFGLARLHDHGENPHTTHVVGTLGYIPPETCHAGRAAPSSDVFAYGILLFEVACGRRPIQPTAPPSEVVLMEWVRKCHMEDKLLEVVDPRLGGLYPEQEIKLVLRLGLLCSQSIPEARPTMSQVTRYLDGTDGLTDDVAFVFSEADSMDLASRLSITSSWSGMGSRSLH